VHISLATSLLAQLVGHANPCKRSGMWQLNGVYGSDALILDVHLNGNTSEVINGLSVPDAIAA
jgi:hypothetical protein